MMRFRKVLLGIGTAFLVIAGAFPAMAEVEKNTLTANINGTEYTFYLNSSKKNDAFNSCYYTLDSQGEKALRISIIYGATKGKWNIIFDDTKDLYVILDKDIDITMTSKSDDGKSGTGTLEVDSQYKGKTIKITDGEFNYTVGEVHPKLSELDPLGTSGSSQSSGSANRKSGSSGSGYSSDSLKGQDCNFCAGLGECDECLGRGYVSCESCFGSGDCQRCYGQGGENHYTGLDVRWIKCSSCSGLGTCRRCKGTGEKKCTQCNGSGNCRYCGGDGIR